MFKPSFPVSYVDVVVVAVVDVCRPREFSPFFQPFSGQRVFHTPYRNCRHAVGATLRKSFDLREGRRLMNRVWQVDGVRRGWGWATDAGQGRDRATKIGGASRKNDGNRRIEKKE